MTRRERGLLGLLLVTAGAALLLLAGRLLFEPVDEEVERGFRGPAAANRLLALERLLGELGVPAVRREGFSRLPPADHVLLVSADPRSLGPAGAARLLSWAEDGGHLVVVPTRRDVGDPLIAPLGIAVLRKSEEEDEKENEAEPAEAGSEAAKEAEPAEEEPEPTLRELLRRSRRPPPRLVLLPGTEALDEERLDGGVVRVAVAHGRGRVTVLNDPGPLTNRGLETPGRPSFAWRTLAPSGPPAGAWLIDRDRRPSPWALLAGRAGPATAALAALIAAWLWKASARFGPLLPAPEAERRSLAEHLRASGRWLWSRGARPPLLEAVRTALRRRLTRGQDEDLEEAALRAAAELGLPPAEVRRALTLRSPADRHDFARAVRVLETLRRAPR